MNLVKQTFENSCLLACLESFLLDNGKTVTQKEMISILHPLGYCTEKGDVDINRQTEALKHIGLDIKEIDFSYPVVELSKNKAILIGTTIPGMHCRRIVKQEEEGKIIMMEPIDGSFIYWDIASIENSQPKYYEVRLRH